MTAMEDLFSEKVIALNFYDLCCGTYSGEMSYVPQNPRLHSFLKIFRSLDNSGLPTNYYSENEALTKKEFIEFLKIIVQILEDDKQ